MKCGNTESDLLLDSVQYEAGKMTSAMKGTSRHCLMSELRWEELKTRRVIHKLTLYFKGAPF